MLDNAASERLFNPVLYRIQDLRSRFMSIRVPKYRHHKASGQAIVTLSGHDHYLGPHDSPASHSAYEKLVAEWLGNGRQLVPPARLGTLSVNELLAAYLAFAESYYSRNGKPTVTVKQTALVSTGS